MADKSERKENKGKEPKEKLSIKEKRKIKKAKQEILSKKYSYTQVRDND